MSSHRLSAGADRQQPISFAHTRRMRLGELTMAESTKVRKMPDPDEPIPRLSLPATGLLIVGLGVWLGSSAVALAKRWPWPLSTLLNAVASYMLFTVAHDAAHRSLSTSRAVNDGLGRIGTLGFGPHLGFSGWRYIHLQHHGFTNYDDGRDPDHYTERGPRWQLPLRWLTVDLHYVVFYLPKLRKRPRRERREVYLHWLMLGGVSAAALVTGRMRDLLLLYFLPIRLGLLWLGFAFDYLPHNGLTYTAREDNFKATRNRVGMERLLSPLFLYQNYHLVHHLHPPIPFHRYIATWRKNEDEYLAHGPALTSVLGRPITPDEYRRLRELAGQPQ